MRLRARVFIGIATLFLLVALFAKTFFAVAGPFLFALFLAAVIDPFVDELERRGIARGIGALMVILTLAVAMGGLAWTLLSNLVREAEQFHARVPEYAGSIHRSLEYWVNTVGEIIAEVPHPFDDALMKGAQQGVDFLGSLATGVVGRAGEIPHMLLVGFVALTTAYFLSRDKRQFSAFLVQLLPVRWHSEARRLKDEIYSGLLGFVRAQAILVSVSGALSIAGLHLFGLRYAWILGSVAGILDIVPMVGPSGVFVPIILWSAVSDRLSQALGLTFVWLAILIIRQILEPHIVSRHVGLHPVTSIAAMYLGGTLIGVNGVLLAPIVAIAVKAICVVSLLPHLSGGGGRRFPK